jgi:hypothetical protein
MRHRKFSELTKDWSQERKAKVAKRVKKMLKKLKSKTVAPHWRDQDHTAYFDLIREFRLKPIESEDELDQATAVINRLVDRGFDNLNAGEEAYLEVLAHLTRQYEQERAHALTRSIVEEPRKKSRNAKTKTKRSRR